MSKTVIACFLLIVFALVGAIAFLHFQETTETSPAASAARREVKVEALSQEEAWLRFRSGEKVVLLDVRQPEEFEEAYIPGSVLVPLNPVSTFRERVREKLPDQTVPVFAFCKSGQRSLSAAEIMLGCGYKKVFNIGGVADWPFDLVGEVK